MFCLIPETTDPYFNLAAEEVLLKNSQDEFLILGINCRSVIVGKHQVAHREADTRFVTMNGIPVIRRISGGGTVYHDPGNLNFAFILNSEKGKQVDFRKYTLPVIDFLASLGVNAEFEGNSDLRVKGLKISGNAEHVFRNRVLHHGTLLFDTRLDLLSSSLRKDTGHYITRAVRSNPSKVTNLSPLLKDSLRDSLKDLFPVSSGSSVTIQALRILMRKWFFDNYPGIESYLLSGSQVGMAEELARSKYATWEWNYAYGPEYSVTGTFEIGNLHHHYRMHVREGIISECETEGLKGKQIASLLKGRRHMVNDLEHLVKNETIFGHGFDVYNLF